MAQITYAHLEDTTRRALIVDRLRAIEDEHWRLTVDEAAGVAVSPGPAGFPSAAGPGDPARADRIAALEEAHATLSEMLAAVEGEPKSSSRRKSS
jgi:hypothetical protein